MKGTIKELLFHPRLMLSCAAAHPTKFARDRRGLTTFCNLLLGGAEGEMSGWLQARVGGSWFDVPHDLSLGLHAPGSTRSTDVSGSVGKRNVTDASQRSWWMTKREHPWGEVRFVYGPRQIDPGNQTGSTTAITRIIAEAK